MTKRKVTFNLDENQLQKLAGMLPSHARGQSEFIREMIDMAAEANSRYGKEFIIDILYDQGTGYEIVPKKKMIDN